MAVLRLGWGYSSGSFEAGMALFGRHLYGLGGILWVAVLKLE